MIWTCTAAEYHADDSAIGSSMLREFIRQPSRYNALYVAHTEPKSEPTPDMIVGTWTHCLVLEPEQWNDRYIVQTTKYDRRTTAGKEGWAKFLEAVNGREVIGHDDIPKLNLAQNMAFAVRNSPLAQKYLLGYGDIEHTIRWEDPITGLTLKTRLDYHEPGMIADLKTAADPTPEGFAKAVTNHGYDLQAALYVAGALEEYGGGYEFYFVVVGKTPPHDVWVHQMPPHWIASGARRMREALARLKIAQDTGAWISPGQDQVCILEPARWAGVEEV